MSTFRRRMMMNTKKSRLPSQYQEVEYIACNNGQYIITDVKYNRTRNYEINSTISFQETSFSLTGWDAGGAFGTNGGFFDQGTGSRRKRVTINQFYNITLEITQGISSLYVDGSIVGSRGNNSLSSYAGNNGYPIFALSSMGSYSDFLEATLKNMSIKIDNELVADFVPCYRKIDGEIGLYDMVGEKFYTNQGTGNFTKGGNV
jgi:hypothetical protein